MLVKRLEVVYPTHFVTLHQKIQVNVLIGLLSRVLPLWSLNTWSQCPPQFQFLHVNAHDIEYFCFDIYCFLKIHGKDQKTLVVVNYR